LIKQVEGSGPLQTAERRSLRRLKLEDPVAYEEKALAALKPINYEPEIKVFLVPVWTHAKPTPKNKWYWSDGREVKTGEITYDYRVRRWFLPPEPISAELSFEKKDSGPTAEQLAKMSPEAREFYRDVDCPITASDLFAKPRPVTFVRGARHVEGSGCDHFRHGFWWTQADIDAAEKGRMDLPPMILPPYPEVSIADSFATKPETQADIEKDRREPYTWKRHAQKLIADAEREQRLLN